jgi:hypothetical protein
MPLRGLRNNAVFASPGSLGRSSCTSSCSPCPFSQCAPCSLAISKKIALLIRQPKRGITARPGADFSAHMTEHRQSPTSSSITIRTFALARRADAGGHAVGRHSISGQALAAIVLCGTVVLCALLGFLLQLPASCLCFFSLCHRSRSPDAAGTPPPPTRQDLELSGVINGQPVHLTRGLSPPPPYSRAPSYESSRSTGGRGGGEGCASSTSTA